MRFNKWIAGILLAGFLTGAAGILRAQSLGEIARQERAKKASEPKAVKVYTNDDIPRATMVGTPTPSEPASSAEAKPAETAAGARREGNPEEAKGEDKQMTKEYWRAEYKKAKDALDLAQEQSNLADDELSLAQANQVREADPTKKAGFDQEIAANKAAASGRHAALDKAKQAMDELKKKFDDSGAPADWWPAEVQKQ